MTNKLVSISRDLPLIMHIDLNSCFTTIEQQSNRLLRGRPVGVAAYDTPRGFVLAASYEAKRMGIKLGVNVQEARQMCPGIIILTPDPSKYREAHQRFKELLLAYSPDVTPKSIDEFVVEFSGSQLLKTRRENLSLSRFKKPFTNLSHICKRQIHNQVMLDIGESIKNDIYTYLGEAVTVNVGISTNRFLAKYAAGFDKPNGMTLIDADNMFDYYRCKSPSRCPKPLKGQEAEQCAKCGGIDLVDLPGINVRYKRRLQMYGIITPIDFFNADQITLKKVVFQSIVGYYWYLRLKGHEIDKYESKRTQVGHQYALPKKTSDRNELARLLMKLCEKVGRRLRKMDCTASGIHLYLSFMNYQELGQKDNGFIGGEPKISKNAWHKGHKTSEKLYSTPSIYRVAKKLLSQAELYGDVRGMAITTFNLEPANPDQLNLFEAAETRDISPETRSLYLLSSERRISDALDTINNRYGEFIVTPATMMDMQGEILDRIAFGAVRDL